MKLKYYIDSRARAKMVWFVRCPCMFNLISIVGLIFRLTLTRSSSFALLECIFKISVFFICIYLFIFSLFSILNRFTFIPIQSLCAGACAVCCIFVLVCIQLPECVHTYLFMNGNETDCLFNLFRLAISL